MLVWFPSFRGDSLAAERLLFDLVVKKILDMGERKEPRKKKMLRK